METKTTTTLKLVYGEDVRRMRVALSDKSFAWLRETVRTTFPVSTANLESLVITYVDEDGDLCTIGGDSEFAEACLYESGAEKKALKLFIDHRSSESNVYTALKSRVAKEDGGEEEWEEPEEVVDAAPPQSTMTSSSTDSFCMVEAEDLTRSAASDETPVALLSAEMAMVNSVNSSSESGTETAHSTSCASSVRNESLATASETASEIEASTATVHEGYVCDGCGVKPIVGVRFKCYVCDDFDLCATCEAVPHGSTRVHLPSGHDKNHPLVKIYTVVPEGAFRGRGGFRGRVRGGFRGRGRGGRGRGGHHHGGHPHHPGHHGPPHHHEGPPHHHGGPPHHPGHHGPPHHHEGPPHHHGGPPHHPGHHGPPHHHEGPPHHHGGPAHHHEGPPHRGPGRERGRGRGGGWRGRHHHSHREVECKRASCKFLAHSEQDHGFCCNKCRSSDGNHGRRCEAILSPPHEHGHRGWWDEPFFGFNPERKLEKLACKIAKVQDKLDRKVAEGTAASYARAEELREKLEWLRNKSDYIQSQIGDAAFELTEAAGELVGIDTSGSRHASDSAAATESARPSAKYVRDATFADGSIVECGQSFTKSWEMLNSGDEAWSGVRLVQVGGSNYHMPNEGVDVPFTAPGASAEVSVVLTAPLVPGRHAAYFRLTTASGERFGTRIWADLNITAAAEIPMATLVPDAEVPTLPSAPDAASGVDEPRWAREVAEIRASGFTGDGEVLLSLLDMHNGDVEAVKLYF